MSCIMTLKLSIVLCDQVGKLLWLLSSFIKKVYHLGRSLLAMQPLQFISPWQQHVPSSHSYKWALPSVAWWLAYCLLLLGRWLRDKLFGAPSAVLPRLCSAAGVSLLVFQEENYAHYVHGRLEISKARISCSILHTHLTLNTRKTRTCIDTYTYLQQNVIDYRDHKSVPTHLFSLQIFCDSCDGIRFQERWLAGCACAYGTFGEL